MDEGPGGRAIARRPDARRAVSNGLPRGRAAAVVMLVALAAILGALLVAADGAGLVRSTAPGGPDYTVDRWSSEAVAGVDDTGRSELLLRETITFTVPAGERMTAFERLMAGRIGDGGADRQVEGVTDGEGRPIVHTVRDRVAGAVVGGGDDAVVLDVRPPAGFAGTSTVVITWRLHDVLVADGDGERLRLDLLQHEPWSAVGPDRQHAVAGVEAVVRLEGAFATAVALDGAGCSATAGPAPAPPCSARTERVGDDVVVRLAASDLPRGSGVRLDVPLGATGVEVPWGRRAHPVLDALAWVLLAAGLGLAGVAGVRVLEADRPPSPAGIVLPTSPASDRSPERLAALAGVDPARSLAAAVVELARRGAVRIVVGPVPGGHDDELRPLVVTEPEAVPLDGDARESALLLAGAGPVLDATVPPPGLADAWRAHARAVGERRARHRRGPRRGLVPLVGAAALVVAALAVSGLAGSLGTGALTLLLAAAVGLCLVAVWAVGRRRGRADARTGATAALTGVRELLDHAPDERDRLLAASRDGSSRDDPHEDAAAQDGASDSTPDPAALAHRAEALLPTAILVGRGRDWFAEVERRRDAAGLGITWLEIDPHLRGMPTADLFAAAVEALEVVVRGRR